MDRIARGDQEAFVRLYQELRGLVSAIVLRLVHDRAITEEVTQETLLDVWRWAARYDPNKGSVRAWTAAIARRRAVDQLRSQQASRNREHKVSRLQSPLWDPSPGDGEHRVGPEHVLRALEALPDRQRQVVELAYYEGHTYREVAVLLDLPEGTVKSRIRHGLVRLRDTLSTIG